MANLLQLLGFPSSTTSASTSGSILGTPTTPNPELTNPNAGLLQYPSAVGSNAGSGPGNPGGNNLYGGTTNYGGLSATQAVAPGTYSKPQNALPASSFPTASYSDLVNNNGTIYNTKTGKGYSNPPELAADLGIPVQNIQWNQIAQGSVPNSNPLNIPATGSIGNIAGDNQTFANSIPISGNQKTATNLSNGSPVYTLADGNSYTQGTNGQPILATRPGDNVDVTPGTSFGGNSISPTTNSSTLGTNPSTGQVNGALQTNQDNETTLFSNLNNLFTQEQNSQAAIQQYGQVGSQEQAAQGQVAQAQLGVGQAQQQIQQLSGQEQGVINPNNQTIAMPFLTGQAENQMFGAQQKLISAQLQQQLAQTNLAYQQGNRQVAYQSAVQLFNTSHQNLADAITMYQAAAPKNIATNYNPLTGAVNTTMINPLTGDTYVVDNGNIGASQPIQNVSTQVNPLTGQLTIVGTNAAGQVENYSLGANGQITGQSQTAGASSTTQPGSLVSSNINPAAVVGGYDLTSYAGGSSATGNYGPTVNSIYQNMPAINNAQDAQSYINSVSKNSPITGQMVMNAAAQYGVDPKVMMSVMQEESSMGTKGMAVSTSNPGNCGNNSDTGKSTDCGTWQGGVNALAQNLSEREINPSGTTGSNVNGAATPQQVIQQVVSSLPPILQQAVKTLPDGTPYIDGNQITSAQIPMAQNASQAGIPYINGDSSTKLQVISTTQKNLQDFKTLADSALSHYGWGGQLLNYAGLVVGNVAGGTKLNDFNSYRTAAINAIQSLGTGQGSGFRLNQYEINVAIDNLPTATDTVTQADRKIADLSSQMNQWISTIVPGWVPPQQ